MVDTGLVDFGVPLLLSSWFPSRHRQRKKGKVRKRESRLSAESSPFPLTHISQREKYNDSKLILLV